MKCKHRLFGIGAVLLILTGCADVPSEVQQEISVLDRIEQQNQSSVTEESGMRYQTLAEIRAGAQSLEETSAGIVRVLGAPVIPSVDSISRWQITTTPRAISPILTFDSACFTTQLCWEL